METAKNYTLSSEVVFQEVAGECVLLDLRTEEYFGLDEVGTMIWQSLADGQSVDIIIPRLLETYEVDEATLRGDVDSLLNELQSSGLIVEANPSDEQP